MQTGLKRCCWCSDDPLYQDYHDHEWGVISRDRRYIFEMLCLEGQQAGLSWITILRKRAHYQRQFAHFEIEAVSQLSDVTLDQLATDAGLIRHRAKLAAIRDNAQAWLKLEADGINVVDWLWSFVDGKTCVQRYVNLADYPTQTPQSLAMSKALKKHGFRFVGATTCYALMQSVGMVNDHQVGCFCGSISPTATRH